MCHYSCLATSLAHGYDMASVGMDAKHDEALKHCTSAATVIIT